MDSIGLSISSISANLYSKKRDDLVLFYFRNGANHASVYTQSKLISENIKWNLKISKKKIKALLINTRNANAFTGKDGFKGLKIIQQKVLLKIRLKQIVLTTIQTKVIPKIHQIVLTTIQTRVIHHRKEVIILEEEINPHQEVKIEV